MRISTFFNVVSLCLVLGLIHRSAGAEKCETKEYVIYNGDRIDKAGDDLPNNGEVSEDPDEIKKAKTDCENLCKEQPQAKAWTIKTFGGFKCFCLKTVTGVPKKDPAYTSGKLCHCDISTFPVADSYDVDKCQTLDKVDKESSEPLPHGAICNLTCEPGSYVGTSGQIRCQVKDYEKVSDRIFIFLKPECRLNETAVVYASIGGSVAALLLVFLIAIAILRCKQNRQRNFARDDDPQRAYTDAGLEDHAHLRGGDDHAAVDRRKSYKTATGRDSLEEVGDMEFPDLTVPMSASDGDDKLLDGAAPEIDIRPGADVVYANLQCEPRTKDENHDVIGVRNNEAIYLEGSHSNRPDAQRGAAPSRGAVPSAPRPSAMPPHQSQYASINSSGV